jgi:hypothetical protein
MSNAYSGSSLYILKVTSRMHQLDSRGLPGFTEVGGCMGTVKLNIPVQKLGDGNGKIECTCRQLR